MATTIHTFGPFRLDVEAKMLFRGAQPTALGQRAVVLLQLLLERAGAPVSKDALIEAAWPGLAIEDANLTVQIASLRRVLEEVAGGASWIETLPRRGYRYIGPAVTASDLRAEPSPPTSAGSASSDKPSVAVLPFSNLSGDAEQEYFADGMVDDIINGLSRIKWLVVIARNSTFTYKGRAIDVKQVARELGVRYVLEGSVRKAAQRVRINGQLIDAATGALVWAERYNRKFDDIFALQDEIALSVLGAIEPGLRRAEVERVKRKRPDSLDAYDLLLQALPDAYSVMPATASKALVSLDRALAIESDYAAAHGYAAFCHHSLYVRGGMREENRAASIRHAQAAIAHGDDDSIALTLAGFSMGMDGHDRAGAFAAFDAALALSPSLALAYILCAAVLSWAGEADRTIKWAEQALRLSPFDPLRFIPYRALSLAQFVRDRYQAAADAARMAVQFNPAFSSSYMLLAAPLARLGRRDEAKAAVARLMEREPAFRLSKLFAAVDCAPELAAALSNALRVTEMPE